ncbi:MAG: sulfotransferase family 2 domain-containing protein [Xanthobacteraceae bacterium]
MGIAAEGRAVSNGLPSRPVAPDVLIHLHIAKTGGTSASSLMKHGFRADEIFEWTRHGVEEYTALQMATRESCERQLAAFGLDRIRYAAGHMPMGVHTLFDRSAKYFTILRHPVDRVISLFYFLIQLGVPLCKDGKRLTFEDYIESRSDINLCDYQVRAVSGCAELDAPPGPPNEVINAPPVEKRHLEVAKRNIEELFVAAAPLEQVTELALLVRRVYGWPMRRLQTEYKNPTKERPKSVEVSPRLIKIIEECNSYDLELYEWVGNRFAEQRRLFEPGLSRDLRVFGVVNRALNKAGEILPWSVRKRIAEILFYAK